ncbi:MAG TPA: transcriptional regulator GcvA [Burkholderiaceae bacterium]|nr:transcriptional regulator GcvA [Burkholderiaceae bacterium]
MPTQRPLPALDFVRGFDAAARHLSFTKAAAELFLTQSAISRQIKALEEQLGVALFQRRHRALVLTEAGRHFHQAAADALRLLQEAAVRVRGGGARRLTLSTTIGFASLWLIPRLNDFRIHFPDIDIRIDANNRLIDLAREEVDVAIRYCTPDLAPAGAQRLFGEQVIVVCSPRLAESPGLGTPADLAHHVLLHYERPDGVAPWSSWEVWLEVQGVPGLKPAGSVSFTALDHLMQAAINGQGVALAPTPLVRRLLAEGKLVAPLKAVTGSARAYYLLVEAGAAARPSVRQFIDWMSKQAQEENRASVEQFYGRKRSGETGNKPARRQQLRRPARS